VPQGTTDFAIRQFLRCAIIEVHPGRVQAGSRRQDGEGEDILHLRCVSPQERLVPCIDCLHFTYPFLFGILLSRVACLFQHRLSLPSPRRRRRRRGWTRAPVRRICSDPFLFVSLLSRVACLFQHRLSLPSRRMRRRMFRWTPTLVTRISCYACFLHFILCVAGVLQTRRRRVMVSSHRRKRAKVLFAFLR
jgi:hypothetical protein